MALAKDGISHKLQDNLHLITAPVQVIWGKYDQVLLTHRDAAMVITGGKKPQLDMFKEKGTTAQ